MNALPIAKRMSLILLSFLLILTTAVASAKDDEHGYLGVMLQNVSSSMSKALQLDEGEGVMINKVMEDSPAAKAGLEDGDVILSFDGAPINDYAALTKAVRATAPGDKIDLEILHDGKRQKKQVELGKGEGRSYTYSIRRDGDAPEVEFFGEGDHGNVWFSDADDMKELHLEHMGFNSDRGYMGVELDDLNEQLGEYFGVKDGKGALIDNVRDDSPAAKGGLKAGDVIVSVNGDAVEDAGDVHKAMADTEADQEVEVKVVRKGKSKTVKLVLGEMPESDWVHAPRMMKHFKHDFDFPAGFDHDIRVIAPGGPHKMREIHRIMEEDEDLAEMRAELDELKKELKELQKELKK
jgi:predicted metalloprotease with PDZ domain